MYLATGKVYNDAVRWSIDTLRETGYTSGICVMTDQVDRYPNYVRTLPLDTQITHPGDSILTSEHMIFEKNIYVDADIIWRHDPSGIFDLLDTYDLVVETKGSRRQEENITPYYFPEINTAIIAFTGTSSIQKLFQKWNSLKDNYSSTNMNRFAFSDAIFTSEIKFAPFQNDIMVDIKSHHIVNKNVKAIHYQDLPRPVVERYLNLVENIKKSTYVRIEGGSIRYENSDRSDNMHQFGTYLMNIKRDIARLFDKSLQKIKS